MVQVKSFYAHNELRNYSYVLFEDTGREAWVIDPYEAQPLIEYIKENALALQGILNTHDHFDHIRGNGPLIEALHSDVKKMKNKEKISFSSGAVLEAMDTPGHTADHQVYLLKAEGKTKALFSGDTLFNSGVGNCKNGGNVDQLYQTTMRIKNELPDETLLYPGHDYAERNLEFALNLEPENRKLQEMLKETRETDVSQRRVMTLGEEKLYNPFLRCDERDLFLKLRSRRDKW